MCAPILAQRASNCAVERGFRKFFEQDVRFAVHHLVALQNRRLPDALGEMTFSRAAGAEKQSIFAAVDEAAGSQIED